MRGLLVPALAVALVATLLSAAYALEKPTVLTPHEGDALGPNYDIEGQMPYKAFLVVLTDVIRADTGEKLRSVPGIRHWSNDDGTFHFRCASPRVSLGEKDTPLIYKVRCFEATPDGNTGPEAVITCKIAD